MSDTPLLFELIGKRHIAQDVLLCEFQVVGEKSFNFSAGQHVILQIPNAEHPVGRAFSIFSHPRGSASFQIIMRLYGGGIASNFFQSAEVGHIVQGFGPRGDFVLRSIDQPIVCIGAGAGIAPLHSMIVDLLELRNFSENLHLLFYKKEGDYDEIEKQLRKREADFFNFQTHFIADERPCVNILERDIFPVHPEFYLCGGKEFVNTMEQQLVKAGFDQNMIYYE
jgi:Na+-transporting NADH:ubiquinone oxidoreductase subunit F